MALPELTVPAGLPPFLSAPHEIELVPVFATVGFAAGHSRTRRLFTTAPRIVRVDWDLTESQMAAVDDWYEDILEAGKRQFAAQVANQGTGLLWWTAEWEEPYEANPGQIADWRVSGRLRLTGTGTTVAPVPSTLRLGVTAALLGSASPQVDKKLSLGITVALLPPAPSTVTAVGTAAGVGTGNGRSPPNVARAGSAAGTSTAVAVPIRPGTGAAAGTSTAQARSDNVGLSYGTSTTAATGTFANRGQAAGTSTVGGVGRWAARGSAAGTSTVTGVKL